VVESADASSGFGSVQSVRIEGASADKECESGELNHEFATDMGTYLLAILHSSSEMVHTYLAQKRNPRRYDQIGLPFSLLHLVMDAYVEPDVALADA